jgi:hypothetical protein
MVPPKRLTLSRQSRSAGCQNATPRWLFGFTGWRGALIVPGCLWLPPPVYLIRLTETHEIAPYPWVHPDQDH